MKPDRQFSRAEDEMILQQSQGKIALKALQKKLRIGSDALERRAQQLGVKLIHQFRRSPTTGASIYDDHQPARIHDDKLLKKLRDEHKEKLK